MGKATMDEIAIIAIVLMINSDQLDQGSKKYIVKKDNQCDKQ
jgi:hypothetical protein